MQFSDILVNGICFLLLVKKYSFCKSILISVSQVPTHVYARIPLSLIGYEMEAFGRRAALSHLLGSHEIYTKNVLAHRAHIF